MIETLTEDGEILKEIIKSILFGGDQLTEERIINAQQGFIDCRNAYEMLQGLKPAYEDWQLKRTLYEVTFEQTKNSKICCVGSSIYYTVVYIIY